MPSGNAKKQKLAIFDIDGTIFRSSLTIALINGLVDEGMFPKKARSEIKRDYLAWLDRKGTYDQYLAQVVHIYYRYIGGCKVRDVDQVIQKIMAREKDRVYVFTRDLVKRLKKEGYFLIAISGSPVYIVSHFARYMGFNAHYGSDLLVRGDVFTGEEAGRDAISNKRKVLERFITRAPFSVNLKRSIAVGDSGSDISMLKMVGEPIAFNPDNTLARYASKKKWRIVVERKNVIYDIRSHRFLNGNI
jgi:HAD superfamily hydrolase (TIGR01490 family)